MWPHDPAVAIVVHDVAPATWPACASLLEMLDELDARPVTLLIVPHFHHSTRIVDDLKFAARLERRLARGDELALHGYYHWDDEPPPRTLRGFIERRVRTRGEGEFAAASEMSAAWRLARGIHAFDALRWPLHGFVPPAWLLNDASRRALDRFAHRLSYVASRRGLFRLPQWRYTRVANLCYSPERAWRRAMSRLLIRRELARSRETPLLRIALHPRDAGFPGVMAHWRNVIIEALAQRNPIANHEWVAAQEAQDVILDAMAFARRAVAAGVAPKVEAPGRVA
jgi:uncharacterized protein